MSWEMRRAVRDVLPPVSETLEKAEVNGEDAGWRYARAVIVDLVREYVDGLALAGRPAPSIDREEEFARAVYDEMFGLGRLQPLVDDPDLENIDVNRYDQVWVTYADGRKVAGPPAADSDEELIELIRRFGAYHGHTARDFSVATLVLHLALSDRSRLAPRRASRRTLACRSAGTACWRPRWTTWSPRGPWTGASASSSARSSAPR